VIANIVGRSVLGIGFEFYDFLIFDSGAAT
jgi:hypothetical protein